MSGTARGTCAAFAAALALLPSAVSAGGLTASASVLPASGYPGARLVATYSFMPKGSCSPFHNPVSWSFGSTSNWATSPAPSSSGAGCASSTPPIAPPSGAAPGTYQVCGTDPSVSSTAACATYILKSPPPSPAPRPSPSPRPTPNPGSPTPSAGPPGAPGVISGTPSPTAPAGSSPPPGSGARGPDAAQPSRGSGAIFVWPWIVLLVPLALIAAGWRYRSWLIGVLENVVVLGKSGADLETELLHTFEAPEDAETETTPQTVGADDAQQASIAESSPPADAAPPPASEAPEGDPGASPDPG